MDGHVPAVTSVRAKRDLPIMSMWPNIPNVADRKHWADLSARLPAEGVNRRYPTEEARLMRVENARWPAGPTCPKCGSPCFTRIVTRKTYHCTNCRHQFSATSGSLLHGTHLPLRAWFAAAEAVVEYNSRGKGGLLTGRKLQLITGVRTPRIYPLMRKISEDLKQPNGGLLGIIVCPKEGHGSG